LLERRTVDARGYLTISNRLFRSYSKDTLGQAVSLASVPRYAELPEEYTFAKPVGSVGMISLRTPMVNCVDGTADAVSVYAAAVGLIHNINHNEAQLNGEFDRGELRIMVSADMFKKDKYGRPVLEDNVFVGLDDDQETVGITPFSPVLREQSFLARKQEYLRNVENVIGLKRGLLSEVEAAERTATEITSSEGEYNLTVIDFQQMWEKTVREAMRVCGILGQLYKVPGAHEIAEDAVTIDWGNGVLFDEEKTWTDYKDMVARGLLKPEIALGWRFNMPTNTEKDLQKIRNALMPVQTEEPEDE
jgi:A118 family predicted phage portal protein